MKKFKLFVAILFIAFCSNGYSQTREVDSIKAILKGAGEDTLKVNAMIALSGKLLSSDSDDAIQYAREAKELADKLGFKRGQAYALKSIGMVYYKRVTK